MLAIEGFFVQYDSWLVAAIFAAAMLTAWGFGFVAGRWIPGFGTSEGKYTFDDASLAVLGLLMAFTFSLSLAKHEQRRTMVIADSNSIGDFYTCASLLSEPVRSKLMHVVHDYAKLRLDMSQQVHDPRFLEESMRRIPQMHKEMSSLVAQALVKGTPIAVSLTNTLNALTSNYEARLAAVEDRLPTSVIALLLVSALISALLVGREHGISGKPQILGAIGFVALVSLAIFVTLDLNQPERGLITVSQRPVERLVSSMNE